VRIGLLAMALGVAMFGAVALCLGMILGGDGAAIFWFANGLPLAVLLRTRVRHWSLFVIVAMAGDVAAQLWVLEVPIAWAIFVSSTNALQYGGIALVLQRRFGAGFDLLDVRQLVWLGLLAAATTLIKVALIATPHLIAGYPANYRVMVEVISAQRLGWILCLFLGNFALALPLLAITDSRRTDRFKLDWWAAVIAALLICLVVLIYGPTAFIGVYLILPPLMLLGWRYGLVGAGLGALISNGLGMILAATTHGIAQRLAASGYGPIAVGAHLELFFAISVLVSLPLAVGRARQLSIAEELERTLSAVQLQEERWRAAIEGAGLGVWDRHVPTQRAYVSKLWKSMCGYEEDDLVPTLDDIIHPDDRAAALAKVTAHLNGDTPNYHSEHRARCKDGSYKWILSRAMVVERAADGAPIRLSGTNLDIDAAKLSAIKAERHSKLFAAVATCGLIISRRDTIDGIVEAVCKTLVDEGGVDLAWVGVPASGGSQIIRYASYGKGNATAYLEGIEISVEAGEASGLGPTGSAFREDEAVWIDDFSVDPRTAPWHARADKFGWRGSAALPIRQRGGPAAVLTLYNREEGYFDEDTRALLKNMVSQIGVAWDALDAEATVSLFQESLQESEQRFRSMFEAAPLGIAVKDAGSGRYVAANPKFTEIVGWSHDDLLTKRWQDITYNEDIAAELETAAPFLAGETTGFQIEKRYLKPDGRVAWVSMTSAPLTPLTAGKGHYLSMVEDVTERNSLKQQLLLAQRMETIGRLTGGIAHDFNNLLTVVMGNSEAMADELADPGLREQAEQILHAAQRAAELTSGLLAFGRQQSLSPRSFDLNQMLAKAEGLIGRTIGGNLDFSVETAPDLLAVYADPAQTESAILNLCLNARDAMPHGGTLTIRCENLRIGNRMRQRYPDARPGDYVAIRVSDTGTGMSPEVIAKIFEPFFTTKDPRRGTGLGLSVVYGFVKQSEGFMDVETEVGKGTTFSVCLPGAREADERLGLPGSDELERGQEKVLLVEDDEIVRAHVRIQLRSLGYDVIEAVNGPVALALLNNRDDVQLLFTDLMMPGGMNGRELAAQAVLLRPSLRILLTSGYPTDPLSQGPQRTGGLALLAKPYTKRVLAEKLREVLGGRG
jgi:PAS domain S-box-containing protein